ncbi:MAG: hypothetical protein CUN56_12350 [Phototrophicales bacterium]|nr:MAG: hypothetical protein CUN56_12350 [Phototrophicales bacterium]RMG78060.1 MAG: DMT family transporter [Chloroflexota bacterium]
MELFGQLAAVAAALSFSVTSTFFTLAGRKYSPTIVMQGSLPVGLLFILLLHWGTTGGIYPATEPSRWVYLSISGMIGLWLGSISVVNAFALLGPRLTLLISSLAPVFSTILAWIFLHQALEMTTLLGIAITIGGITWVVSDKNQDLRRNLSAKQFRLGILFALGAAVGQASASVLSAQGLKPNLDTLLAAMHTPMKLVMQDSIADFLANPAGFNPLTASLMRLTAGMTAIWLVALLRGTALDTLRTLVTHRVALGQLLVGAVAGPVLGASLMLVALQNAPVGIASTLSGITPIFLIPVGRFVFAEQITKRAIIGTCITVMGTAILFL